MDYIEGGIKKLSKILNNLKKSPGRKYRKITLIDKLNASRDIYNEILTISEYLNDDIQKFQVKAARLIYGEIRTLIDAKLERNQLISFKILARVILVLLKCYKGTMAKVDIKTGTALVETYDGKPDKLESFIDSVTLFSELVDTANETPAAKAAAKIVVTRFIKTRLSGAARQAVPENSTLEELIAALREHCSPKITPDNILAKLKNIKQTTSTDAFCEEVEKLTMKLKSVYISKHIPTDVATQMATKSGIDALIRGAKNNESRIILKAGSFVNFNDAVQKFLENSDRSNADEKNVQIFYSARGNNRVRGRFSHSRGNSNQRFQSNNRGSFHNNRGNFYGNRGNYQNRGNFHNNRGNFSNRRGNWNQQSHHNNHHGMYMAQQSQYQPQQQLQQQMLPQSIPQVQQQINPVGNHPLGVPFGQHTQ